MGKIKEVLDITRDEKSIINRVNEIKEDEIRVNLIYLLNNEIKEVIEDIEIQHVSRGSPIKNEKNN